MRQLGLGRARRPQNGRLARAPWLDARWINCPTEPGGGERCLVRFALDACEPQVWYAGPLWIKVCFAAPAVRSPLPAGLLVRRRCSALYSEPWRREPTGQWRWGADCLVPGGCNFQHIGVTPGCGGSLRLTDGGVLASLHNGATDEYFRLGENQATADACLRLVHAVWRLCRCCSGGMYEALPSYSAVAETGP